MTLKQRFRRFLISSMVRNSGLERRRFWVAMMYVGLAGWTLLSLMMGLPSFENALPGWTIFVVFLFFAGLGALGFFITASTSAHVVHGLKAAGPQDRVLDERQRSVWDRASRKAYFVVLVVLLFITGYWMFVWPLVRLPETEVMVLLSLALFLLTLSLPNAIVAWTEPDVETTGDAR